MAETLGYITFTVVLVGVLIAGVAMVASWYEALFRKKKPPRLAGAAVPETGDALDIAKRYDIVYSGGDYGSQFVERLAGVRIVGYIGRDDETVGKMYMQSRWLVVEFADGRRAYLMPHAIVSLQESAPG